ncbi:hypothetical protein BKA70DRAFT_466120 [Coprinopsis sp. MPI-PUGE-AT-0042]|nr:hypothetical protein BKA70DRAFT_466120 [Coprinopsis sp. MPI-PUGE-AT-0042]
MEEEEEEVSMADEENEAERAGRSGATRQLTRLATEKVEDRDPSASWPVSKTRALKETAARPSPLAPVSGSSTSASQSTTPHTPRRPPGLEHLEVDPPYISGALSPRRVPIHQPTKVFPHILQLYRGMGSSWGDCFLEPPPRSSSLILSSPSSSTMKGLSPTTPAHIGKHQNDLPAPVDLPAGDTGVDMPPTLSIEGPHLLV